MKTHNEIIRIAAEVAPSSDSDYVCTESSRLLSSRVPLVACRAITV